MRIERVQEAFSGAESWGNWMPLARATMYAQGTQVHVAARPGSPGIPHDNSRLIAREGRMFVVSSRAILRANHFPPDFALLEETLAVGNRYTSGGSIIVAPTGEVLAGAVPHADVINTATIDLDVLRMERHNFDRSGHYSRPDVFELNVDRRRHSRALFTDD